MNYSSSVFSSEFGKKMSEESHEVNEIHWLKAEISALKMQNDRLVTETDRTLKTMELVIQLFHGQIQDLRRLARDRGEME